MNTAVPDEPEQVDDQDEDRRLQHYDEAYARQYENDHTWDQLQEDEHGNLRVVRQQRVGKESGGMQGCRKMSMAIGNLRVVTGEVQRVGNQGACRQHHWDI